MVDCGFLWVATGGGGGGGGVKCVVQRWGADAGVGGARGFVVVLFCFDMISGDSCTVRIRERK